MADAPEIIVLGGGGHAAVLIDALVAGGERRRLAVLDADPALAGTDVLGVPVAGDDALLPRLIAAGARFFVVGLGGTRDTGPRRRLYERACALGLEPLTVIHPRAVVSAHALLAPGVQVLAAAVVVARAAVGANVIVNTGAIVEHDCVVGEHVHVATGARLCGGVTVGAGAHVGAGAVVRQSLVVGSGAVVGAGAVVVADVAPAAVVVGVPAKDRRV